MNTFLRWNMKIIFKLAYIALTVPLMLCFANQAMAAEQNEEIVRKITDNVPIASPEEKKGFIDWWNNNLIFKNEILLSGGYSHEQDRFFGTNSLGFDLLKKFSGKTGDWAIFNFQPRFVRRDNQIMVMNHTEGEDDFEFEIHEASLKWTRWFRGRLNFKIGHFDIPFGLEPSIDTHSSLVQLISMRNTGVKKDWGVSLYGQLRSLDYEIAATRGVGMQNPFGDGNNYLISGRVGSPSTRNFTIGLSGLYGRGKDPMAVMRGMNNSMPMTYFGRSSSPENNVIRRYRIGLDSQWFVGPLTFKAESSFGQDANQYLVNSLFETDWLFFRERLEGIIQFKHSWQNLTSAGSKQDISSIGALKWRMLNEVTLWLAYEHQFERMKNAAQNDIVSLMAYVYF